MDARSNSQGRTISWSNNNAIRTSGIRDNAEMVVILIVIVIRPLSQKLDFHNIVRLVPGSPGSSRPSEMIAAMARMMHKMLSLCTIPRTSRAGFVRNWLFRAQLRHSTRAGARAIMETIKNAANYVSETVTGHPVAETSHTTADSSIQNENAPPSGTGYGSSSLTDRQGESLESSGKPELTSEGRPQTLPKSEIAERVEERGLGESAPQTSAGFSEGANSGFSSGGVGESAPQTSAGFSEGANPGLSSGGLGESTPQTSAGLSDEADSGFSSARGDVNSSTTTDPGAAAVGLPITGAVPSQGMGESESSRLDPTPSSMQQYTMQTDQPSGQGYLSAAPTSSSMQQNTTQIEQPSGLGDSSAAPASLSMQQDNMQTDQPSGLGYSSAAPVSSSMQQDTTQMDQPSGHGYSSAAPVSSNMHHSTTQIDRPSGLDYSSAAPASSSLQQNTMQASQVSGLGHSSAHSGFHEHDHVHEDGKSAGIITTADGRQTYAPDGHGGGEGVLGEGSDFARRVAGLAVGQPSTTDGEANTTSAYGSHLGGQSGLDYSTGSSGLRAESGTPSRSFTSSTYAGSDADLSTASTSNGTNRFANSGNLDSTAPNRSDINSNDRLAPADYNPDPASTEGSAEVAANNPEMAAQQLSGTTDQMAGHGHGTHTPINHNHSHTMENDDAIPFAGGVKLGSKHFGESKRVPE
ncbi:hypothetical protein LTR53_010410 [Teratosphaeriaceae sp. CCFEE 6253]|nr:hypothetical protein LTR53_010410 [Teratosphaeriaceae sp. CCFEE 6253]